MAYRAIVKKEREQMLHVFDFFLSYFSVCACELKEQKKSVVDRFVL